MALAGGFMAQTFSALSDAAIRGGIGHLQVMEAKALQDQEDQSLQLALPDAEALAAKLRALPEVAEVLPRIQFMGLLTNGGRSVAYLGTAVDPEREPRFMAVLDHVRDAAAMPGGAGSRWLSPDPGAREVLLGPGLAKSLGASAGSSLTLMATTKDGALNAVDVTVAGLLDQGVKELNDRALVTSLGTAEALLDAEGARSRLSVVLKDPRRLDAGLAAVRQALPAGAAAVGWRDLAAFYKQVRMLYLFIFGFMGLVLFLVVWLATANTLLMSVMERVREFGVLRALGLQPGQLVRLLQWEGAAIGALGGVLGLIAALALRAAANAARIEMPAPPGSAHGYPLHIEAVPLVYLGTFLFLQLTLQVAALYPGLKAAKLRIVEALRHV
jgi:putative ABC transport system permease protein